MSHDGGTTWEVVKGVPTGLMPHRAKIVDGDMYVTFADGPGPYNIAKGGVYKYNIKAGTWTDIPPFDDNEKEEDTSAPKLSFSISTPEVKKPKKNYIKQFLAFSDSRQQASFFASFFESNHNRFLRKKLIWEEIKLLIIIMMVLFSLINHLKD